MNIDKECYKYKVYQLLFQRGKQKNSQISNIQLQKYTLQNQIILEEYETKQVKHDNRILVMKRINMFLNRQIKVHEGEGDNTKASFHQYNQIQPTSHSQYIQGQKVLSENASTSIFRLPPILEHKLHRDSSDLQISQYYPSSPNQSSNTPNSPPLIIKALRNKRASIHPKDSKFGETVAIKQVIKQIESDNQSLFVDQKKVQLLDIAQKPRQNRDSIIKQKSIQNPSQLPKISPQKIAINLFDSVDLSERKKKTLQIKNIRNILKIPTNQINQLSARLSSVDINEIDYFRFEDQDDDGFADYVLNSQYSQRTPELQ